jgi:hypothetical protein
MSMPLDLTPNLNEVTAEIQPAKLQARGFFPPQRVSIIEGKNSDGEPAYYVYLVYPDRTPDAALTWKKVEPMVSWVWKYVSDHTGQTRWPYVKVKREHQLPPELLANV